MSESKNEKSFFSYLQRQFSKNDFIHLNSSAVPKNSSNKLNRFYNDEYSLWFARLRKTDTEKYYYFGLKYDQSSKSRQVSPRMILRFSEETKSSCIRFIKNQIAVIVKVENDSEVLSKLNKTFILKTTPKNKASGIYYLFLGKAGSKEIINNLLKLAVNFSSELTLNTNVLRISEVLENNMEFQFIFDDEGESTVKFYPISFDTLKFNFKAIEFKNKLKNKNLNSDDEKLINDHIFSTDDNDDFLFNEDFKRKFSKSKYELFDLLDKTVSRLSNDSNLEDFLQIIDICNGE